MKKHIIRFLLFLLIVNVGAVSAVYAYDNNADKDHILVQVYINNYDEEYIKNIELDDGSKIADYNYEIEYMPVPYTYILGDYFNYAAWITRDDGICLSLDPVDDVRENALIAEKAWGYLEDDEAGFGLNKNWPKTEETEQCFYWQYTCHAAYASQKDRWNLEPYRTADSYLAVVLALCNP